MKNYSKISIIGDQDTIEGFEIAGLKNQEDCLTISVVNKDDSQEVIEKIFKEYLKNKNIGIIMICDFASNKIRNLISKNKGKLPSVLVIPSKINQ